MLKMLSCPSSSSRIINFAKNEIFKKISYYFNLPLVKPTNIAINITHRCNLKCKTCTFWRHKQTDELSTDQWKRVFLDLKRWLGSFWLDISGGEPLLRRDLFALTKFATSNHIKTRVITNGFLLNDFVINKLIESGLDSLHIF